MAWGVLGALVGLGGTGKLLPKPPVSLKFSVRKINFILNVRAIVATLISLSVRQTNI